MHDLVITGGTIIDGSGNPAAVGDIAVDAGRITQAGGRAGPARRTINADGRIVTPGWVDIHTHYDGQATWDPYLTPSSWHGATTVVMGNCGVGFAPANPASHDWLIELMEGVEDIPGSALAEGINWSWETFPEYLDALEGMPRALDIGTQAPHGAIRAYVMGERGARNEEATADDIAKMSAIVEEALRAGALGFSSSRTMLHRSLNGEPVPGTFAGHDELVGIGRALGRVGHGVFEIASDFGIGGMQGRFGDDIEWMSRLSKETGRPVSFALGQSQRAPNEWREILAMTESAVANGANLLAQVAVRPAGMLFGFESSFHPFFGHPTYMQLAELPVAERLQRLAEPSVRDKILSEESTLKGRFSATVIQDTARMFPLGDPPVYEPKPDCSIEAIAARKGVQPLAELYDLMLEQGGRALVYYPLLNYADFDFEPLYEQLNHPHALLSLSDGGAHCGLICDVSSSTYLLSYWTRDRDRGPRLGLEQAVAMQTRKTALAYGLADRGLLAPGLRADINIIDYEQLGVGKPEIVYDLPAKGRRLIQKATGYDASIVAGEPVFEYGEPTGAMPGKLIRGPQLSP
ncbi:MAG: amidohydrolase family protein [Gammaproteobacteria bacterium]|nr:amidohydrolase family protein [Gammaproteobacteria bacterium]